MVVGAGLNTYAVLMACPCDKCAKVELSQYTGTVNAAAAIHSIGTATPGFVSEALLDFYPGDTTTAALELCLANLWLRCDGGYQILHNPLVDAAIAIRDRIARCIAAVDERAVIGLCRMTPDVAASAECGSAMTGLEASAVNSAPPFGSSPRRPSARVDEEVESVLFEHLTARRHAAF